MTTFETRPRLRLVGVEEAPMTARAAVARENRAAACNLALDPTDPRWVLAVRAHEQLQGASLTFDRRQRLLRTARLLGVRPFDANIVLAIVQDHARRGQALDRAAGTIALLEAPAPRRSSRFTVLRWVSAAASAAAATTLLIQWLMG